MSLVKKWRKMFSVLSQGRNFIIDLFVIYLTHRRVSVAQWLRALECRIQSSEVQFLKGSQNFYLMSHALGRTKTSFSSSMGILKRGQLLAALHRLENSSTIDAAIQIFLYLPMSRFDSQSLYNICTVRWWLYVYRVFSYLHLITW